MVIENKIFLLGDNKIRVDDVINNLYGISSENIKTIEFNQLVETENFKHNIIIIVEELGEVKEAKLNDKFLKEKDVVIIDTRNNFEGLPIYNNVIYLPEITIDHGQKIIRRQWDELSITSDINKLERFKRREVSVKKYERVFYEEIEQELDFLRKKVEDYDEVFSNLNQQIASLNEEIDRKVNEVRSKDQLIEKINIKAKQKEDDSIKEKRKLKDEIRGYQERERRYKKMFNEASKKYDLIGFGVGHKVEERKQKIIKEAAEQGKKVLGIVGDGKYFIEKMIDKNDSFVIIKEPEKADLWLIITTPDKDSVEQFKELIMGKPFSKSIKVMTLWNDHYPFTPESLVESNLDLIIPYCSEFFQFDWLDKLPETDWRIELNNLLRRKLS